jgi:hypothetical protein|tara:strand:- start:900 stop:1121 length:222 start_codon:yes stop_codon:yes gene_type:complete
MVDTYKIVIDFYNNTTAEQKKYFLELLRDRISIPTQKKDGVHVLNLDQEVPVILNGIFFQLNTEEWKGLKKDE